MLNLHFCVTAFNSTEHTNFVSIYSNEWNIIVNIQFASLYSLNMSPVIARNPFYATLPEKAE